MAVDPANRLLSHGCCPWVTKISRLRISCCASSIAFILLSAGSLLMESSRSINQTNCSLVTVSVLLLMSSSGMLARSAASLYWIEAMAESFRASRPASSAHEFLEAAGALS